MSSGTTESRTYSIVIPAYNESERITATLDKVLAHIAQQHWTAEIVVVNDGSRDNTAEIVRRYGRQNPAVRLVENPGNRGKGFSVRNGMMNANGDVLLFTDADLSSPIYEAKKLFDALDAGADVAIGSRWLRAELQTQRQSLLRQIFSRVYNLLLRIILGLRFVDTQCGFKAFKREAAQQIFPRMRIERWGFDPEALYLARKAKLRVDEIAVEWANDDRSKVNPVRDGIRMFTELLRVRWNDLTGKYTAPATPAAVTTGT
ncbi:MAG: glycosyltransferase family 2 protein [Acidobacteriota bacterium]|nr:glycosyltransferase family 2 protein [Acidobacteriota bacterium]